MATTIQPNESREAYLERAKNWAYRNYIAELDGHLSYRYSIKELRRRALVACEAEFTDLGTFGVEVIARGAVICRNSPTIQYLNTGDTYGNYNRD